ncbi:MAG: glycosyltransferase [Nitrospirae bacterium]|nr:glycosyltransferase [Nitrospirota bacterium]
MIQSEKQCHVCSGRKIQYIFSIKSFRVEKCVACGLKKLNPQPTEQELSEIYGPQYFPLTDNPEDKLHATQLKARTADHYLDKLELYMGGPLTGHLLEVGCGYGDFLERAAARGLSVTGIEYSAHSAEVARKKLGDKGKVLCGTITQFLSAEEQFDFIVFVDVLEHVRNPRAFLRNVHKLLRKDGVSMAIVPSLDSFSARLMKNKWMEFKPEHLWYFSKSTLKQLFYGEHFGKIRVVPAKKTLSFDYIAQHFRQYPVRFYSSLINFLQSPLPRFLRRLPIRVTASGIIMFARKKEAQTYKRLSVIMAAYNEGSTIRGAIERVLAKKMDGVEIGLIIVESNSTDHTGEIIQEYQEHDRVKVVWQEKPRGKGNAIRAGLQQATGDYIMIQDADDEYDIEDYDALLDPLVNGEADFVLGARHGGNAWKMRHFEDQRLASHFLNFGHWFFTTLVNLVYGVRLKDPFTMYKVFRNDCLNGIAFECNRFDFDFELVIKLVRKGYRPIEIPVNYRSRSFKEGKKVNVVRDPLTWLRAIIKFRFQKL